MFCASSFQSLGIVERLGVQRSFFIESTKFKQKDYPSKIISVDSLQSNEGERTRCRSVTRALLLWQCPRIAVAVYALYQMISTTTPSYTPFCYTSQFPVVRIDFVHGTRILIYWYCSHNKEDMAVYHRKNNPSNLPINRIHRLDTEMLYEYHRMLVGGARVIRVDIPLCSKNTE